MVHIGEKIEEELALVMQLQKKIKELQVNYLAIDRKFCICIMSYYYNSIMVNFYRHVLKSLRRNLRPKEQLDQSQTSSVLMYQGNWKS